MKGKDRRRRFLTLGPILRTSSRVIVGAVLVGTSLLVALAAVVVGIQVLRRATVVETILLVTVVVVFTAGYWYAVWRVDANGIGPWNEVRSNSDELDQEWAEELERR